MLLSAVSALVVAQSSSEIPEGLMNNPIFKGRSRGTMREASSGATAVPPTFIYSGLGTNPDVCGKNSTADHLRRGTGLRTSDKRVFILFCFVLICIFKISFLLSGFLLPPNKSLPFFSHIYDLYLLFIRVCLRMVRLMQIRPQLLRIYS